GLILVDDGDGAVKGLGLGAFAVDGDFEGDLAGLEAVGVALPPDVEDVVTVGFGGLGLSGQGVLDAVALLDPRDGDVDALRLVRVEIGRATCRGRIAMS